jgi:hypothetical protein
MFDRLDADDVRISQLIADEARHRYVGRRYGRGRRPRSPRPVTAWRQRWLPNRRPLTSVTTAHRWLSKRSAEIGAEAFGIALVEEALDGSAFGNARLVTVRNVREPLRSLAALVAELTFEYPCWTVGGATMFVLADVDPSTRWITFHLRGGGTGGTTCARRVRISVVPSVNPPTLAAAWRYRGSPRATPLQLQMAAFLEAHPDETWERRRKAWNEDEPAHMYSRNSRGAFVHNMREAYWRVYGHYP